jgi:amidohydrolase
MLSNQNLADLVAFRRALHQRPELSGAEVETAGRVVDFLKQTNPDQVITGLGGTEAGGTGVAVVYDGVEPGPTVMVRAELDGLPIHDLGDVAHHSQLPGKGHLCGHDGHMAMLCALGLMLARNRPARGRAILLFQPAEETGQGAAAVLDDPQFQPIAPDIALSLHNLPGLPLGHVGLTEGPFNCASRGLQIELTGKTAHASMPETGVSPMQALAQLMPALTALGTGGALQPGFRLVTLTHAQMGEPAFGIAPGAATLMATLRCLEDADMAALCAQAEALVSQVAETECLTVATSYHDIFLTSTNAPDPLACLHRACDALAIPTHLDLGPMRWSEDFGRFGHAAKSAMFVLGSGEDHAQLHNPDYDFPDDLIPIGAGIFDHALHDLLG